MARLLLVRHGETEFNSSQRYWGRTDVALGAVGLRQAEALRDRLADEKIDFAYSSDLKRARVTAETIASVHNIKVNLCPELKEIDFGEVEGLNFEEVAARHPEVARMWIERRTELAYPGGESLAQMENRVAEFKTGLDKHADGDTILVVAHSGVLRTLVCQLLDLELKHRWNLLIDLASLSIVDTYPEGSIIDLLNDVSHLTDKCRQVKI